MKEIAATKLKAACLAVIEDVRKTKRPVRVARFGKPVAEIVPVSPERKKRKSWLGCMAARWKSQETSSGRFMPLTANVGR